MIIKLKLVKSIVCALTFKLSKNNRRQDQIGPHEKRKNVITDKFFATNSIFAIASNAVLRAWHNNPTTNLKHYQIENRENKRGKAPYVNGQKIIRVIKDTVWAQKVKREYAKELSKPTEGFRQLNINVPRNALNDLQ